MASSESVLIRVKEVIAIYTTKIWRALMKKFGLFRGLPLHRNGKINFMPLTQRFDKSVVILNKLFMKELEVSLP